ncbi:hypothetical protein DL767_007315 [Monosporascus sp. MG133]|nr:hypothetical protein DL767_007315 [Monosporascus sp. MG133]
MASFTREKDDNEAEFDAYSTSADDVSQLTRYIKNMAVSSQVPRDALKKPSGQRTQEAVSAVNEALPITYQLMSLINNVKFTGNIFKTGFGHHDFAARGSRQIARGGYFQAREVPGLGVAKYPLLPTASRELSTRSYRALANELRVLSHPPLMKHDNIVKINTIGWTRLDPVGAMWMPMVFLELAELGTLTQYLSENHLDVDSKLEISQDVGHGLQALHACGITHGDLKFDNILLFKGEDGKVRAKLSDFGCCFINDNEDKKTAEITAGTKPWNSPELGQEVSISWLPRVDAYAFGLLVWRVFLNGRNPFEGLEEEDIEQRKSQDIIISDASLSLENEYDRNMLLRGAPLLNSKKLVGSSVAVEFLRLFDIPCTARTMFFRSLQQVAEDDGISRETRANAYLQLCYANIDSFGTVQDFGKALKSLKSAAQLGSHVAASILQPLILATGKTLDSSLGDDLKLWVAKAVEAGSLFARDQLRPVDEDLSTLKKAEEPLRLFMGAKSATPEGVATADLIEMLFLPVNLGVMKVNLDAVQHPWLASLGAVGMFMSRSMNTYLHAGAALGVEPDHFRNAISVASLKTINAQDDAGNTPLHLALRFGNVEIAQILLEHGARASLANKRGETPWHWLISLEESDVDDVVLLMCEDTEGLEILSRPRHSTNDQYAITHGGSPLHWAVDMRRVGMALTLLSCGADPLHEYGGMSPIDLAIKHNAAELLEAFLDDIAEDGREFSSQRTLFDLGTVGDTDDRGPTDTDLGPIDTLLLQATFIRPLHERLIYNGMDWLCDAAETLRLLQENGNLEPWRKENNEARIEALRMSSFADSSWTEVVEAMMEFDIFPGNSLEDNDALDENAAATFWKAALKRMLPSGRPAAIQFAIDQVRRLSSTSRLDDAEDILSSYCSSLSADISVVESILKDCKEVDCVDEEGRTPLMKAVRERNFEIATYLLGRGADVGRAWTHEGKLVYMLYEYVVNNTDIDVVPIKYLLEPMHPFKDKIPPLFNGPTHKDTILHQACKDGNPVIVEYLLSKFRSKEQLDQPGIGGFTALHHAVYNGHAELVMRLCRAGADVNARSGTSDMPNRQRSRPLDLCFRWSTQSKDFLSHKYGLEHTREDIFLSRLRIADYLIRRHQARRASRFLVHRTLALKFALGAAEDGMTRLLAVALRKVKEEMDMHNHPDVDYSLLLNNLLWVAAPRGHVSATRLLLGFGADVEQRSIKDLPLLHLVAWLGKAEMVYVLVKNGGADVNAEDAEGETLGSYSVNSKDLATIRMVKSLGGRHALPRERMTEIMRNSGIDPYMLPPGFNPRFTVRFTGEPSDEELSDNESEDEESKSSDTDKHGRETDEVIDRGATEDKSDDVAAGG